MSAALTPSFPVLVVDDEPDALSVAEYILRSDGLSNILCVQDSREVTTVLAERAVEVVLLDLTMPYSSGEVLLSEIVQNYPDLPVIVISGTNELETAVRCMKNGAFDYLVKPVDEIRMASAVRRALRMRSLSRENGALKQHMLSDTLAHPEAFSAILSNNLRMRGIFQYLECIAETDEPVLVTGETGTGKELIVKAIHALGKKTGKLLSVNVAGLDETVFADTLFGHVKGAFTGANERRDGFVQKASGGTLFLDEIGDLNSACQIKLLRLLQEREYFCLGSDTLQHATTRIVVATNQDLDALQGKGKFREDLYYRLQTHHLHIPPLRDRPEDLPLLLDHFLGEAANSLGKTKPTPPHALIDLLSSYHFPGNVRELRAMVFDAVAQHRSRTLSMTVFSTHIHAQRDNESAGSTPLVSGNSAMFRSWRQLPTLKESARLLVAEAMARANGNQRLAAKALGVSPPALSERLKRYRNETTE